MRNDETPEGDTPRQKAISIHSLRVEGDLQPMQKCGVLHDFNPLPPCGGRQAEMPKASATFFYFNPLPPCGGRRKRAARAAYIADFNPLPPCGGRPNVIVSDLLDAVFQSTPSVWRETENISISPEVLAISIHSLRVEGDRCCQIITYKGAPFQPTPSVWRETSMVQNPLTHGAISIHSLRVEGDA